jgi:hypothetical protein
MREEASTDGSVPSDCRTPDQLGRDGNATEKGHTGLASYYTERGESPGVWIESGMDGIDGLAAATR